MNINTLNNNFQHFSCVAGDTVRFARPTSGLVLTTSTATLTVNLDGCATDGYNSALVLAQGTFQFTGVRVLSITFGGTGSVTGIGYCV